MPKLSYLLEVQSYMQQVSIEKYADADAEMLALMQEVLSKMHDLDSSALSKNLRNAIKIKQGLADQILSHVSSNVSRAIESANVAYQSHNKAWCSHVTRLDAQQHAEFMNANYGLDLEMDDFVRTRIRFYSNWQETALLWNMGDYRNLDVFFGFYPIFVADKWMVANRSIIEDLVAPLQLRKIRTYDQDKALEYLPQSCFKIIVSRNHFSHCNLETLDNQVTFFIRLLRKGGTICFNFNDCEEIACAASAEMKIRSFILGKQVRSLLAKKGLEIIHWEHLPKSSTTWVEAQLPGEYKSIKLGETMGVITKKSKG